MLVISEELDLESLRVCKTCNVSLPIEAFRIAKRKDGKVSIRSSCKACETEKQRIWRLEHPEQNKQQIISYEKQIAILEARLTEGEAHRATLEGELGQA